MEQGRKNIIIIGGGAAGIEAAKSLDKLGYTTFLIEKDDFIGGHLAKWDRLFPEGKSAKSLLEELKSQMGNVKVFLNTEITSINKLDKRYNVILSNGISISADALLFTTGFSLFDAHKKEEYGYGIYDKVITNSDLESYFAGRSNLPTENPTKIGFVHCVGSRDEKVGNRHCSKVCCATAVKQACEIKEKFPNATVYCFYMDLRMFGRGYEDLYLEAQKKYGVIFVRGRVSEVSEELNGRLFVKAEDTLSGKPLRVTLDLLVLMSGMVHNNSINSATKSISMNRGSDGFFQSKENILYGQQSYNDGIFLAGTCTGPKTLPETLADARAAALSINQYLSDND